MQHPRHAWLRPETRKRIRVAFKAQAARHGRNLTRQGGCSATQRRSGCIPPPSAPFLRLRSVGVAEMLRGGHFCHHPPPPPALAPLYRQPPPSIATFHCSGSCPPLIALSTCDGFFPPMIAASHRDHHCHRGTTDRSRHRHHYRSLPHLTSLRPIATVLPGDCLTCGNHFLGPCGE